MEQLVARQAHNLEVARSSPASATITSEVVDSQHFGRFPVFMPDSFRHRLVPSTAATSRHVRCCLNRGSWSFVFFRYDHILMIIFAIETVGISINAHNPSSSHFLTFARSSASSNGSSLPLFLMASTLHAEPQRCSFREAESQRDLRSGEEATRAAPCNNARWLTKRKAAMV